MYGIMPIIYNREQGNKVIKNMQKTSEKTRIALDKPANIVYNTGMRNNNNNKENTMDKLIDTIIIGSCILTIVVGSIFGALMLIQTL